MVARSVLFESLSGGTRCVQLCDAQPLSVAQLKERISGEEGVPAALLRVLCGTRPLRDGAQHLDVEQLAQHVLRVSLRVEGGKGGFGTLLKTKKHGVKTTHFGAMRDLSGRRVRHVDAEKQLDEWMKEQEKSKLTVGQVQEDYEAIKHGRHVERRTCYFGANCRYQYKCKFVHPGDEERQEHEKQQRGKRKKIKGLADEFGGDSAEDALRKTSFAGSMHTAISVGLRNAAKKRRVDGRGDEHDSPAQKEQQQRQQQPARTQTQEQKQDSPPASSSSSSSSSPPSSSSAAAAASPPSSSSSSSSSTPAPSDSTPPQQSEPPQPPMDLSAFESAEQLCRELGADAIKQELQRVGLKSGGTEQQRSERLFLLKDSTLEQLPRKMFAKKKPGAALPASLRQYAFAPVVDRS